MANVFQDIFGGSSANQQSTSTTNNYNPFTTQQGGNVDALGNSLTSGLPQFGGPTTAPMAPNEGSVLNTLMGQQQQGGGVMGTNDYLASVLKGNFMPGSPQGNPFLQNAITAAQRTTMNNLGTTLSQSLPGYFTANGQMISPNDKGQGGSSAFNTSAALAEQTAANTMADIAAPIASNAYTTGVGQMQGAAQLSQAEITNTISNLQAQALPRMITNLGITNGLQLYQENLSGVLNLLATLGGIAKPVLGTNSQSTGQSSSTPGIVGDAAAFMPKGPPAK